MKISQIFFFFIIHIMKSLCSQVVIDRNFGMKTFCLSGLEQISLDSSNQDISNQPRCIKSCYEDTFSNSSPISTLLINGSNDGLKFNFNMTEFNPNYSYILVEINYFISNTALLLPERLRILATNGLTQQKNYTKPIPIACQFSGETVWEIKPQMYMNRLYTKSDLTFDEILSIMFSDFGFISNETYMHSILVTTNCVLNCKTCASEFSCSVCQDGFQKYPGDTEGQYVCEQVGGSSIQNCKTYTLGLQEICRSCMLGFTLDSSGGCNVNISSQINCLSSEYEENGKCLQFSSIGYYESESGIADEYNEITQISAADIQSTYQCPFGTTAIVSRLNNYSQFSCRCLVKKCLRCSSKDTCDLCEIGYRFDLDSLSCKEGTYNTNSFSIKQVLTQDGFEIRAVFEKELMYATLTQSEIELSISDFSDFKTELVSVEDSSTVLIKLTMLAQAKNKEITIKFSNEAFVQANFLNSPNNTTPLLAYVQVSDSDKEAAKTAESIGVAASGTIVGTLLIIAIISNFSAIVSTIDLTGFLYYLLYIEARFPVNIISFYAVFKNFQLDFIPNPFTDIVSTGYMQLSAVRFMQADTDAYFLSSTGQSVTILLLIVIMYLIAKILSKSNIPLISNYFQKSVYETWEYGGYFDAVWTIYIYLLIGVLMQFQDFDCSDSSCGWNYFIFSISFLVSFGVPALIIKLIHNNPNLKENQFMKTKLSSLISGVRLYSEKEQNESLETDSSKFAIFRDKYSKKLTKYYMPILYVRKIIFALIIVCLSSSGYAQLTLITLLNIGMTLYFILLRPLESTYENYKGAISEIVMIVFQILVGILIQDPDSQVEADRINIGWAAIGIVSAVITWHSVGIIYDFIIALWAAFKAMIIKRKSSKVVPIDLDEKNQQQEKSGQEDQISKKDQKVKFDNSYSNNGEVDKKNDESLIQNQKNQILFEHSNRNQSLLLQSFSRNDESNSPMKTKAERIINGKSSSILSSNQLISSYSRS